MSDMRIKRLKCSSCGAFTTGRQWHGRDAGYGICDKCVTDELEGKFAGLVAESYGQQGIHYLLYPDKWTSLTNVTLDTLPEQCGTRLKNALTTANTKAVLALRAHVGRVYLYHPNGTVLESAEDDDVTQAMFWGATSAEYVSSINDPVLAQRIRERCEADASNDGLAYSVKQTQVEARATDIGATPLVWQVEALATASQQNIVSHSKFSQFVRSAVTVRGREVYIGQTTSDGPPCEDDDEKRIIIRIEAFFFVAGGNTIHVFTMLAASAKVLAGQLTREGKSAIRDADRTEERVAEILRKHGANVMYGLLKNDALRQVGDGYPDFSDCM